jgi:HlyD family secretion protein
VSLIAHSGATRTPSPDYGRDIRTYRRLGFVLIGLFVAIFGGWAGFVPLSSAVVAAGRLEIVGDIKRIQHEDGGRIAEIAVSEGQTVKAGDLLLRLDDTTAQASFEITAGKLDEALLRAARLRAERDLATSMSLPTAFAEAADSAALTTMIAAEQRLFRMRTDARAGQKAQTGERVNALLAQIEGQKKRDAAKAEEIGLARAELERARSLAAKGAIAENQISDLERTFAQLRGQKGQIEADLGDSLARLAEARLQVVNVDLSAVSQAGDDLNAAEALVAEYQQRLTAVKDQLAGTRLVSPVDGIVHQLAVHTIGGVAKAGDVLMTIVPTGGDLMISARVMPADINAVIADADARVRFAGLNRSTTPELNATITRVGTDLVEDPVAKIAYYPVDLVLKPGEAERLKGVALVAGMPVEAYLLGPDRTFFSYLMKPLLDRLHQSLRE